MKQLKIFISIGILSLGFISCDEEESLATQLCEKAESCDDLQSTGASSVSECIESLEDLEDSNTQICLDYADCSTFTECVAVRL